MRFATIVFRIAGVWGLVLLPPLYFLFGVHPAETQAPLTYTQSYFGFLAVTLAWQVAFLVIGSDPLRFRPMMIPAMLEKFIYVVTHGVLYLQGRAGVPELVQTSPDLVLGVLFVMAFIKTSSARSSRRP
jgi:uncharacterized membrane protein YfcA